MPGNRISTVKFNYNQQSRSQLTPLRPVMVPGKQNKNPSCPEHKMQNSSFFKPRRTTDVGHSISELFTIPTGNQEGLTFFALYVINPSSELKKDNYTSVINKG